MRRIEVKIRNRVKPVIRLVIYSRIRAGYHVLKMLATIKYVAGFEEVSKSTHWKTARSLTLRSPVRGLITGSVL